MKTMTKKLSLLFVLSATLLLSSCLGTGEQSHIGSGEYSYIELDQTTNTIYARTDYGYFITSPKIQQLSPGTTAFLSYQVTEQTETTSIGDNIVVYKVTLGAEPVQIDQSILQSATAPNVPPVKFESLTEPYFRINQYFGDRWLFQYEYKAKKGENVRVNFYKATEEEAKENNTDVLIDIRLEKFGTPDEGSAEKLERNFVSADMSLIRSTMADKADYNGNVNIKLRYYRSNNDVIYISNRVYTISIDKATN